MRILIVYGTTDGHTAALAAFAAQALRNAGHDVLTSPAAAGPPPSGFDAAIIAASLHAGHYQAPVIDYVRTHRAALSERPSAFVSVSLSAAGHDHEDWEGLEACVRRFEAATGWIPDAIHHAAGAFAFTRYGFLVRQLMKRIARKRGLQLDARRDYDLTDYEALRRFALDFASESAVVAA